MSPARNCAFIQTRVDFTGCSCGTATGSCSSERVPCPARLACDLLKRPSGVPFLLKFIKFIQFHRLLLVFYKRLETSGSLHSGMDTASAVRCTESKTRLLSQQLLCCLRSLSTRAFMIFHAILTPEVPSLLVLLLHGSNNVGKGEPPGIRLQVDAHFASQAKRISRCQAAVGTTSIFGVVPCGTTQSSVHALHTRGDTPLLHS